MVLFGNEPGNMQWRWFRNGVLVNATERIKITFVNGTSSQTRMSIREITLAEGGLYECVVANRFGSNSQSIQVNVHGEFIHIYGSDYLY